jgi:hypothetical protein
MPRSGGGVYSKPAGTTAVTNTTIESAKYNSVIDDLVTDANAARPISAGGTGAANAADARTNLGGTATGVAVFMAADAAAARTAIGISATNTPFTPAGNIAATDVQAALAELDTEKAIAADTWTKAEADNRYPVSTFMGTAAGDVLRRGPTTWANVRDTHIRPQDIGISAGAIAAGKLQEWMTACVTQQLPAWVNDGAVYDCGAQGATLTPTSSQFFRMEGGGTLLRSTDTTTRMLHITGGRGNFVRGVTFEYTAGTTAVNGENSPVLFRQGRNGVIEDCRFIGPWYVGPESRSGDGDAIRNNDIRHVINRGIYLSAFDNIDSRDCVIAGNTIDGYNSAGSARVLAYGINLNCFGQSGTEIWRPQFVGNIIRGVTGHGIDQGDETLDYLIAHNTIYDGDASIPNILLQVGSTRVARRGRIIGNTTDGGAFGVSAINAVGVLISQNRFNNPTYSAVQNYGSVNIDIIGNSCDMLTGTRFYQSVVGNTIQPNEVRVLNNTVIFVASLGSVGVNTENASDRTVVKGNYWKNCQFPNLLGTGANNVYSDNTTW